MKANRKFLNNDDEAVSPVIAVILMVAITVVLAATVYVWVSGFGSNQNTSPAHTMSITSAGAVTGADDDGLAGNDYWYKTYTVSSASPSLTYGDFRVAVGGTQHTLDETDTTCGDYDDLAGDAFIACASSTNARASTDTVQAGDSFIIACHAATDCLSNDDLLITDIEANSVMVTLKVR